MRFIIYTTSDCKPGSIGTRFMANTWMWEGAEFHDCPKFDHWAITGFHEGGLAIYRQRRFHIQSAVDELIATGAQVCTTDKDASLVRWFSRRPLPSFCDYGGERLAGARKDSAIKRYRFRPPPGFAGRKNMPTEVVIFAPNIAAAYEELVRRTWFRDIDTRSGALAKWLQKIEHAGCVGGDV